MLFPGHAHLHIAADGRLLDDTAAIDLVEYPDEWLIAGADYIPIAHLATFLPFALFAISALHKHAEVEQITPRRPDFRRAKRDGDLPPQEHFVIRAETPAPIRRTTGKPTAKQEPQRRHHSVRGHFKTYTEAAPLFGRIVATVWVPAHERGKATGDVTKDYRLVERKKPKS